MPDQNSAPSPAAPASILQTLLVVEDEILLRLLLADELRARSYTVIEAANADDALAILLTGMHVDALVSDVVMPGDIDGTALVSVVRNMWPAVKIVIASAHSAQVRPGTADAVFTKPYDLEKLFLVLESLLAARPASPHNGHG